ncbi:hypothetical protein BGZ81_011737 [Podila clonocystis]|nr:hypothetical protein BGZ81_011737 [Podila clonocystis]
MFNFFSHPAFHSGIPAHRNPHDEDSEEKYLRAALERKRQQRFARQQYLHQQQELAEQQRNLLERQRRARAAQTKYETEKEATRQHRVKKRHLKKQQRTQMGQKREQDEPESLYRQQQEDPLAELISSLFLPFIRPHTTEYTPQSETVVNTNGNSEREIEVDQDQKPAEREVDLEQEAAPEEDLVGDYFAANPKIKSLVESLLGTHIENREIETQAEASEEIPEEEASVEIPVETDEDPQPTQPAIELPTMPVSVPSSVHSSPELHAADILKQREERHLSDKHAQLNSVEATLNSLSLELQQIIAGTITTKNQILATEESLTKAMFKIDAVENAGDSAIRRRRKELITQSQDLLEKVDAFKGRESEQSKEAVSDSDVEPEQPQEIRESVEEQDATEAGEIGDEDSDIDTLSDIESIPDVESDREAQEEPVAPEDESSPEPSESKQEQQQEQEGWQEQDSVDPIEHILGSVFAMTRSSLCDQYSIFRELDSIFA